MSNNKLYSCNKNGSVIRISFLWHKDITYALTVFDQVLVKESFAILSIAIRLAGSES